MDNSYNVSDDYEKNLEPVLNYYDKRVFEIFEIVN